MREINNNKRVIGKAKSCGCSKKRIISNTYKVIKQNLDKKNKNKRFL